MKTSLLKISSILLLGIVLHTTPVAAQTLAANSCRCTLENNTYTKPVTLKADTTNPANFLAEIKTYFSECLDIDKVKQAECSIDYTSTTTPPKSAKVEAICTSTITCATQVALIDSQLNPTATGSAVTPPASAGASNITNDLWNNASSGGGNKSGTGAEIKPVDTIPNVLNTTDINVVIGRLIKFLVGIAGSLALIVFIYGGLMWLISRGDAGYIKKGKEAMTFATIGLVIIFSSYIIVRLIITLFTGN